MKINNEQSEDATTWGALYFLFLAGHYYRRIVLMHLFQISIVKTSRLHSIKPLGSPIKLWFLLVLDCFLCPKPIFLLFQYRFKTHLILQYE